MDFYPTKEEEDFLVHVKQVLDEQIKPNLREWKEKNTTPRRMFQILGENGLLGFSVNENNVNQIPWQRNISFYRDLAQLSGGCAIAAFAHSQLGVQSQYFFGSEEQKTRYMLPGALGHKIIAFANTEPGAGSDAASISLSAKEDGPDFVVNGTKAYITNGDIADNIVFTAVTHPEKEKKHARISMFIVDGDSEGLKRTRLSKIGWAESHLATLKFNDVRISNENLIGELGRGFYQTMKIFNSSRIGISALAFGTSLGAYKLTLRHAKSRNVFGSSLFEHQSKKNEFADYITRLEAGWLLVQKAAFLKDMGKEFRFNASMAKLFNTKEGLRISQWAQETFGARGVLTTNQISEYPNDAKAALIGEGAPEVQKKIVSEHIDEILNSLS
jgi:alkylation response protein AidB-like acyl-CoA dehydrogenase